MAQAQRFVNLVIAILFVSLTLQADFVHLHNKAVQRSFHMGQ